MTTESNILNKISLPIFLISLPLTAMSVLLPIFTTKLGMTPIQITGLSSVFSLGLVVVRLIIGHISDNAGRKPIFILGILFYLFSYFIYSKALTLPSIYLARGLQSIAAIFISISTYSMIADMNNKNNNAHSFGKLGSYSEKGGLLGIALCFLFLYGHTLIDGWRNLFLTCSIASGIALIYSIINIKETRSINNSENTKAKFSLPTDKIDILVFNLISSIFTSIVSSIFVLYLQAKYNADLMETALAFILPTVVISFSSPYIGTVCDNIGVKKATSVSLGILFISLFIIPYLGNIYLYGVIWTIYCIALTMLNLTIDSSFVENMNEETRGAAIGQLTTAANIGSIIGPIAGGLAFQNIGLSVPYLISSLGFVLLLIYSFKIFKNTKQA